MKSRLRTLLLISIPLLIIGIYVCVRWYEFVFSKSIHGVILRVERVNQVDTIIAGGPKTPTEQLFSFAVSIKDEAGVIHTASSEDRQWAVASTGQCVNARFFPYPPWEMEKYGTYHGARMLNLYDCPPGLAIKPLSSGATPPPAAAAAPSTGQVQIQGQHTEPVAPAPSPSP